MYMLPHVYVTHTTSGTCIRQIKDMEERYIRIEHNTDVEHPVEKGSDCL